jgi:hypothetical protein
MPMPDPAMTVQPVPLCPRTNAPHEWVLIWGDVVCGHCGMAKQWYYGERFVVDSDSDYLVARKGDTNATNDG